VLALRNISSKINELIFGKRITLARKGNSNKINTVKLLIALCKEIQKTLLQIHNFQQRFPKVIIEANKIDNGSTKV
jgi:hypothetical protein